MVVDGVAINADWCLSMISAQKDAEKIKEKLEEEKEEGPAGEQLREVMEDDDIYQTPRLPDEEDKKPNECVDD